MPKVAVRQPVQGVIVEVITAVDLDLLKVDRALVDGSKRVRQVKVAQHDHGRLVLLGQVEAAVAGLEALLNRAWRRHDPRKLAVRRVQHKFQIRLLGACW